MAMERARSSLAALLFLTLVVLAAASASGGADDDAAAAVEEEKQKQCHPRADEPYTLVAFHNKDGGEEMRLLADRRSELLSGVTGFANRSGHWFYSPLPQPQSNHRFSAEGLWNTLGVLVNTNDDEQAGYMLVGMETGGGDKIRLVVVADQRYFFITGYAKGFSSRPRWSFRDGERHRLLPLGNGSSHGGGGSSQVVASNALRALMNAGKACCG